MLALNALHIAWSQVIRTDIHASVFMLASLLFAARIAEHGRLRDYLLAGAFAGLATATKWPAATVLIATVGASLYAQLERGRGEQPARRLIAAAGAALAAIFVASPFIFLDWRTVLATVSGEMSPGHLGHSGGSFFDNLAYYLSQPVMNSIGLPGLLLMIAGVAIGAIRSPIARWTMIPATFLFLALICSQNLIWSRWILPVMPMFCIFIGVALATIGARIGQSLGGVRRLLALGALAILVSVPMLSAAIAQSRERANDTRGQAARWAVSHIPAGSRVVFEHLELSVRDQPWTILFPIGDAGCIDGVDALRNGVSFDRVQQMRRGSPIIDLGNVSPGRRESCRADFAILAYYDLYRAEAAAYPAELANYDALLAGGRTVALFRPVPGEAGGPVVRILALPKR